MPADSTASGACTSGWIAPPKGATRRASGFAVTTSTTRAEQGRENQSRGQTPTLVLSLLVLRRGVHGEEEERDGSHVADVVRRPRGDRDQAPGAGHASLRADPHLGLALDHVDDL